jgi:histidinol dehydrogenase
MVGLFENIATQGGEALRRYTKQYEKVDIVDLVVGLDMIKKEARAVATSLRKVIDTAFDNISLFHAAQKSPLPARCIETQPGVVCWCAIWAIEWNSLCVLDNTASLIFTTCMLIAIKLVALCRKQKLVSSLGFVQ